MKTMSVKQLPKIGLHSFLTVFIFFFFHSYTALSAQQNSLTVEGGYSSFYSIDFQGWKINGLYEFHPKSGKLLYGVGVGYVQTSDRLTVSSGGVNHEYILRTFPIVIAPKLLIGNGSLQGFIKADLGYQFSTRKRIESTLDETNTSGFYGGVGAGFLKSFGPKYFMQLGYEIAWLESTYFSNELDVLSSILIGVGSRFE